MLRCPLGNEAPVGWKRGELPLNRRTLPGSGVGRILLDTKVVSEMMRPQPEPRIADFLGSIAYEGIGRLEPARRRRDLADWFQALEDDHSRTGSSSGPWPMRKHARGSWRTSADAASRSTSIPRMLSLRLRQPRAGLPI